MSKKAKKHNRCLNNSENNETAVNVLKISENCLLDFSVSPLILKRWVTFKTAYSCKTNEEFLTKLLDLAQTHLKSEHKDYGEEKQEQKENKKQSPLENVKIKRIKLKKTCKIKKKIKLGVASKNCVKNVNSNSNEHEQLNSETAKNITSPINETADSINIPTNYDFLNNKSIGNNFSILEATLRNESNCDTIEDELFSSNVKDGQQFKNKKKSVAIDKNIKKEKLEARKENDTRRAPELNISTENIEKVENNISKDINQIKICTNCNTSHDVESCPLYHPAYIINDSIEYYQWEEKYKYFSNLLELKKEKEVDNFDDEDKEKFTFAKMTLPNIFYLCETSDTSHGFGVVIKEDIQPFTQFGPLIGKIVKEVDISKDSPMRDVWEIVNDKGNIYINTEDLDSSNWLRYMRPAPTRDERNVTVICKENKLYFVSVKFVQNGDELLYWQDSNHATNKKKMEKTTCGGCNMTFVHPLYYRTHCSVFHDIRYSLTIRKYHCKICGAAVLGKENIMKHAAELHNGQGAYQCQFCKKFFLRLNYLEMHRTYGCSANPHRSRPLCDFCGRKFCQPQKLKVHIKRMHSDFSEVLKEFQCKNCLKILGSRAALQRHLKEVHQKQIGSTCSCIRCGKHFQNKSNLKIHMLTHSGIKPFKCAEKNCNAAFTTKQCLQFHYKKVHNLIEDAMPKIERSINYTFEAYSGIEEHERFKKGDGKSNLQTDSTAATMDEESDFDEASMDSKSLDDPPALHSPLDITNEPSPQQCSPPIVETFNFNTSRSGMKILSKGSKKWIEDQPLQPIKSTDLYQLDQNRSKQDDITNLTLHVQDTHMYDRTKLNTNLNTFARHESSNASLLVEAALDSVCSEPNIDIDVSSTPNNCADTIVNNLYTLAPPDTLPDVSYSDSVCMNESKDINLISPSVNDHISVTDELNDELQQNQNMDMEYSSFHQEEFSPANSPGIHQRNNFVRNYINSLSPQNQSYNIQTKNLSPVPSPPRYDFGHAVNTDHLSSDDSNGMAAQNLSLHNPKNDIQLDLSIYKSPYKLDPPNFQSRKDFRVKFDENDRKQIYVLGENIKSYQDNQLDQDQLDNTSQNDISNKGFDNIQVVEIKDKETEDERCKYPDDLSTDLRHKFDLDLDLRIKNYDVIDSVSMRLRSNYESENDLDFRNKNYDLIDSIENRNKIYETIDSDFRTDRNFEPLVLNSSELQGLDMSARSFHNYPNLNRYHHLYPEVDRVDLRLNYSPPPPAYTHADILRVVSLDLTPPGRHSVDLSLRSHSLHQIANSRLLSEHTISSNPHRLLDQSRLLSSDLTTARHLSGESRLISESSGRILSDHTTNRILSNNDQLSTNHLLTSEQSRLISDDSRLITEQPRLLEQSRLISDGRIIPPSTPNGSVSPVPTFTGYSVSQSPYHPTPLAPRPHVTSPTPTPYHHYSAYY